MAAATATAGKSDNEILVCLNKVDVSQVDEEQPGSVTWMRKDDYFQTTRYFDNQTADKIVDIFGDHFYQEHFFMWGEPDKLRVCISRDKIEKRLLDPSYYSRWIDPELRREQKTITPSALEKLTNFLNEDYVHSQWKATNAMHISLLFDESDCFHQRIGVRKIEALKTDGWFKMELSDGGRVTLNGLGARKSIYITAEHIYRLFAFQKDEQYFRAVTYERALRRLAVCDLRLYDFARELRPAPIERVEPPRSQRWHWLCAAIVCIAATGLFSLRALHST